VFFNDVDDSHAASYHAQLTPQPLGVYLEEIHFDLSKIPCPKHYLACRHDQALGLENNLVYAERLGGTTSVLDAGHDVMLSQPKMLAHGLMERLTQR
jgi:pimeloyl-ACP methyl ester carboxylesterase